MSDLDSQVAYWDAAAATKTFTHPVHLPWLEGVVRSAAILDYGCGYGRTMALLEQHGFERLAGVDTSSAMIARARDLHPAMRFAVLDTPPIVHDPDASVDVILLFAVLTCIPGDSAQRALVGEAARILKPGGLLYISDLLLQDDERNRSRYAEGVDRYGTYGVFETSDGAVCRHHPRERFASLLADFETLHTRDITVLTMNGNPSAGIQLLVRKPDAHHNGSQTSECRSV
jgi:SAM-dependent methyltransferase